VKGRTNRGFQRKNLTPAGEVIAGAESSKRVKDRKFRTAHDNFWLSPLAGPRKEEREVRARPKVSGNVFFFLPFQGSFL